jgi:hypothetical protein
MGHLPWFGIYCNGFSIQRDRELAYKNLYMKESYYKVGKGRNLIIKWGREGISL